jgi:hypothetical protein
VTKRVKDIEKVINMEKLGVYGKGLRAKSEELF